MNNLEIADVVKRLPKLYKQVQCLKKEIAELDSINSIDSFVLNGTNLDLTFTDANGQSTLSANIATLQQLEIKDNVLNYNELATITNPDLYQFAYVRESQGASWLPGSLGGSYYGSGLYMWNGTEWIEDDTDVFNQLQQLIDNLNLEIQQRINNYNLLDNRITTLENEEHILFETLPNLP